MPISTLATRCLNVERVNLSCIQWDRPPDGQYLTISKRYLFKNLDLLGSNTSRNNQIFWRTVDQLKEQGYILSAQEVVEKKKMSKIQFTVNPEKLKGH